MFISFNVSGAERKRLAQVLGEYLSTEAKYLGAPGFAYQVGGCIIDKGGTVSCPETMTHDALMAMTETLKAQGFIPLDTEAQVNPAEENARQDDAEVEDEDMPCQETDPADVFTVSLPRGSFADDVIERLKQIIANKATLFRRALQTENLQIVVTDDEVSFPWFKLIGADGEKLAYSQFIAALCRMAREQTRILDKPYDGDNDRFAMRIFMVRLGMKGDEYGVARKLLLKHLSGNSGWRYGAPPKKVEEENAIAETADAVCLESDDSAEEQEGTCETSKDNAEIVKEEETDHAEG